MSTKSREVEAWNLRLIGHSDLNGHGDVVVHDVSHAGILRCQHILQQLKRGSFIRTLP